MALRHRTCNLCEAMCGLAITVEEGRITDVRGDLHDPLSRGHICPKGPALRETYEDPDRLRHPVRRTAAGGFERVSWAVALDEAAAGIDAVRRRHGRDAVGLYSGNPTVHSHGAAIGLSGFARALGSRNRFDANSQDANPKLLVSILMFGDQLSITIPDVDHTDFLLMLGANPAASNGSLMSLGDVRGRLGGVRERGGRFVLIDPRRTETARWADTHHFIRPGGDAALLLGLHHVLFAERLVDEAEVRKGARGLDDLKALAARFPPERVAAAVGIDAATIATLARQFAAARRAVCYGRVGVCQSPLASVASWLVESLNVVTGNFDRQGGMMFPVPAVDVGALARKLVGNSYGRWRSRLRGLPELGGQLPAAVMAEEMETPGEGQIRAFITFAGNPVLSTPNGERLERALAGLDFMVSIDPYINETTRHAHLILPPLHALERSHYDVVFHTLAVRNGAKYGPPVMPRPDDGRGDWEILYQLGMRLGGMRFGVRAVDRIARLAWQAGYAPDVDRIVDLLLRLGPYGDRFNPLSSGLSLARLRRAPHGVDLGPLRPARATKVRTDDGKVDLAPRLLVEDAARVDAWLQQQAEAGGELLLIGRRGLRDNNSWMHNCPSLVKGPERAELFAHPDDAARLGLRHGEPVRVRSRVGAVVARLKVTGEVMPGVVSLPHGFGHGAARATLRFAGPLPGPNVNAITDEQVLDPLSGTAALSGLPVTLEPAPAIALEPPPPAADAGPGGVAQAL